MQGPDGLEEREFERDEDYERYLDELELNEQLADESRDDLEVTLVTAIPPRCIVFGHSFDLHARNCTRCGEPKSLLDIAADRLRAMSIPEMV